MCCGCVCLGWSALCCLCVCVSVSGVCVCLVCACVCVFGVCVCVFVLCVCVVACLERARASLRLVGVGGGGVCVQDDGVGVR